MKKDRLSKRKAVFFHGALPRADSYPDILGKAFLIYGLMVQGYSRNYCFALFTA